MGLYIHTCACVRMYACTHVRACMWSPEDSLGHYSTGAGCLLSDTGSNPALRNDQWLSGIFLLPFPQYQLQVCADTLIWNRGVNSEPYPCTAKFCQLSHLLGPVRLLISYFEDLVFLCACYFWLHESIFPYFSITNFLPLIQMKTKAWGDILHHEGLQLQPWFCPDITVKIPCRPQFPHGN